MTIFFLTVISPLQFRGKSKLRPSRLGWVSLGLPLFIGLSCTLNRGKTLGTSSLNYPCLPLSTPYSTRGITENFIKLVGTARRLFHISVRLFTPGSLPYSIDSWFCHSIELSGTCLALRLFYHFIVCLYCCFESLCSFCALFWDFINFAWGMPLVFLCFILFFSINLLISSKKNLVKYSSLIFFFWILMKSPSLDIFFPTKLYVLTFNLVILC